MAKRTVRHYCESCGSWEGVEKHHTFPGIALRRVSEEYGAVHYLCHYCHQDEREGVQHNGAKALELKMADQHRIMVRERWNKAGWLALFGKSYLDADELEEIAQEIAAERESGNSFCEVDYKPLFC